MIGGEGTFLSFFAVCLIVAERLPALVAKLDFAIGLDFVACFLGAPELVDCWVAGMADDPDKYSIKEVWKSEFLNFCLNAIFS